MPRSYPSPAHCQVLTVESLREPLCKARYYDVAASGMLRRAPNFTVGNWGSANAGFTLRTGLADLIYLHPFGPFRFSDMLFSPSGFPSRLAGCPEAGASALDILPLWGNLTCAETAHHKIRYGVELLVMKLRYFPRFQTLNRIKRESSYENTWCVDATIGDAYAI